MSVPPRILQGVVGPEAIRGTIVAGQSGIDLTTVSAVSFSVKLPNGTVTEWLGTIDHATQTSIQISHVYELADTPQLGTYRFLAILIVPAGVIRVQLTPATIVDPFS